ncbi:MAG: xanthine dehydrogenase molybdopterin binding subunit, partial [Boseongicola sp.]
MTVAKPLPHDAARLHVTGQARYVDDIPLPRNALHLAFGTSSIAHGKITSMNLDPVRAAPGVVAVLIAEDLPHENDVSPSPVPEPLLSEGSVHFVGQPIFLVVAESHLAARKAARLGQIEYDELPAILSVDEALAADSRFEEGPRVYTRGDPTDAISDAAHVVEGRFDIGGQEHFYLEGQAAAALPQEGGDMIVHSSTQHPTEIQHKVAEALGRPMNAVRCEIRRMGGGFGGKESQGNHLAVSCAVAAELTGRPCTMRYDRDDDMNITGKRHDFRIDYRVGFGAEGRISGVEFLQLCRCGWSQDLSLPVADRAMLHADNAYFIPNMRIESHRLKTNTQSGTAFRGFGGPQGMVGIERVLDHVAHTLGRDPVEIRQLNYYRAASAIASGEGDPQTTPYDMPVEDFVLHEMTDHLVKTSDYKARRDAVRAWNASNDILKKGIALTPVKFGISFTLTHLNQAGALVHVYQDGSIHMNHCGTEMGQGLIHKIAQVAAARFGVETETIKITATDTAKVPNTSATAASSGSDMNGMAVKAACDTICDRLAGFVAERAQADVATVRFEGGMVHVGGESLMFNDVIKDAYMNRISLSATGFYKTPLIVWDRIKGSGRPVFYFAYGAAVTEVVIDTLTGENRMLRADILHDCGASLNPALDIGQVEGG